MNNVNTLHPGTTQKLLHVLYSVKLCFIVTQTIQALQMRITHMVLNYQNLTENLHPLNIAHTVKVKLYNISQIHVLLKSGR